MPDDSLGLMSTCRRCGGTHVLTGHERLGAPEEALGSGPRFRTRYAQYVCESCGAKEWSPTGTVEEPSESDD